MNEEQLRHLAGNELRAEPSQGANKDMQQILEDLNSVRKVLNESEVKNEPIIDEENLNDDIAEDNLNDEIDEDTSLNENSNWLDDHSDAHRQGYKAFHHGYTDEANPFPKNTEEHGEWLDGWYDGKQHDMKYINRMSENESTNESFGSSAYELGYEEYMGGSNWNSNPHKPGSPEYDDWKAGWKKARNDNHLPPGFRKSYESINESEAYEMGYQAYKRSAKTGSDESSLRASLPGGTKHEFDKGWGDAEHAEYMTNKFPYLKRHDESASYEKMHLRDLIERNEGSSQHIDPNKGSPYGRGYQAQHLHSKTGDRIENPYPSGSDDHNDWRDGWDSGERARPKLYASTEKSIDEESDSYRKGYAAYSDSKDGVELVPHDDEDRDWSRGWRDAKHDEYMSGRNRYSMMYEDDQDTEEWWYQGGSAFYKGMDLEDNPYADQAENKVAWTMWQEGWLDAEDHTQRTFYEPDEDDIDLNHTFDKREATRFNDQAEARRVADDFKSKPSVSTAILATTLTGDNIVQIYLKDGSTAYAKMPQAKNESIDDNLTTLRKLAGLD